MVRRLMKRSQGYSESPDLGRSRDAVDFNFQKNLGYMAVSLNWEEGQLLFGVYVRAP